MLRERYGEQDDVGAERFPGRHGLDRRPDLPRYVRQRLGWSPGRHHRLHALAREEAGERLHDLTGRTVLITHGDELTTPESLRAFLLGTWRLESHIDLSEDGSVASEPLGGTVEGQLIYVPDGFMSVQMMRADRRPFASGDWFPVADRAG